MSSNNSFKKNTILLTMGTVINKGLQFMVIPFFSKWLSTEEYGRFDLFYTYVSLLLPIITLSIDDALFRNCVDTTDDAEKKKYITNAFVVNIINVFICTTIILLFANDKMIQVAFCIYLSGEVFSQYLRGYLRGIKRLDIYSVAMVVNTLIMIAVVIILVYFCGYGIIGMLMGYAIGTWGGNIIICIYSKWYRMINILRLSMKTVKDMVAYSLPLVPNALSWWIMNASDRQIINWFFGDAANGIYAIAHKIPALCSVIFNMFTISWQQEASIKINAENREEYFNEVLNEMYVILAIICSSLFAVSFILYHYIFDIKYIEAQLYSPIMILAAALMALSQFYGGIQIALKESKKNGITTIIGAVVNVLVHIMLIKHIGLFAAAVSTFVGNLIILLMRKKMIKKVFVGKVAKHNCWLIAVVIYFFIMTYVNRYLILNISNLVLICIVAFICGKDIFKKFIYRKRDR